ncbi:MAG: CDP-diglyceride synthetase, partial [Kiritimatiellia bacterium]
MQPDPFIATVFLLLTFFIAGIAQVIWLKSDASKGFTRRLDGGRMVRGRPLFGPNKTWRGFMVMVPAIAILFAVFGGGRAWFGPAYTDALWALSTVQYALLGAWVGFAFMLAELPNSFVKRQLDVSAGSAPDHPQLRTLCFLVDQVDSVVGSLIALALCV